MLNLTLRFTGGLQPWAKNPCCEMVPETLEVTLNGGTQRVAISTMPCSYPGQGESVRERNARLRASAQEIGRAVANQICRQLREMGHAV